MRPVVSSFVLAGLLAMGPGAAFAQDPHAGHTVPPAKPEPTGDRQPPATEDHSAHIPGVTDAPKEPIPVLTDADRAAAFPTDLGGHAVHDRKINAFVLFEQLEWQGAGDGGPTLENKSWFGGDINRMWLRAEGDSADRSLATAQAHVLYGRSFSRWWDFVVGVRQDFRPGPGQTWAAFGVQGLAPYWFDLAATGYVGADGRTHARFEAEYDLLFTNRLIVQPLIEMEIYGKHDPEHGFGAGLATIEPGLRLRYEFRREFAPYVGFTWERRFFGTAELARERGQQIGRARVALGVRTWF